MDVSKQRDEDLLHLIARLTEAVAELRGRIVELEKRAGRPYSLASGRPATPLDLYGKQI